MIYRPGHCLMRVSTHKGMQDFIKRLIHTHSIRVEHYKVMLGCTALEVEEDIQLAMAGVWVTASQAPDGSPIIQSHFEMAIRSLML